jgi:hypothetical protein
MKNKLLLILILSVFLNACNDDDDFVSNNPQEFLNEINLEGIKMGDTAVYLQWTNLKMGDYGYYQIFRETSNDTASTPNHVIASVDHTTTSFIDNNLSFAGMSWYRIMGFNINDEQVYSNAFIVTRDDIIDVGYFLNKRFFANTELNELIVYIYQNNDQSLKRYNYLTGELLSTQEMSSDISSYPIPDNPNKTELLIFPHVYNSGYETQVYSIDNLASPAYTINGYNDNYAANDRFLFELSSSSTVSVYDIDDGSLVYENNNLNNYYDYIFAAPWENNILFMIDAYDDYSIAQFNSNGQLVSETTYDEYFNYNVEFIFAPTGGYYIAKNYLYHVDNPDVELRSFSYTSDHVFSSDGTKIYYVYDDYYNYSVYVYDIETETSEQFIDFDFEIEKLIVDDDKLIFLYEEDYHYYLYIMDLN